MKVLAVLVNSLDRPSFDDAFLWEQFKSAFQDAPFDGVTFDRLKPATEAALCDALQRTPWDILHILAHPDPREAAAYCTVPLLSSDGHSRPVAARHFAAVLAESHSLKALIFQAIGTEAKAFCPIAESLVAQGFPVSMTAPAFSGKALQSFLNTLYQGIAAGDSLNRLSDRLRSEADKSQEATYSNVCFFAANKELPIVSQAARPPIPTDHSPQPTVSSDVSSAPTATPSSAASPPHEPWQEELRRKRDSGMFDVFLSHNSEDKPQVRQLATDLMRAGILPWLDEWELPPGQSWQPALYDRIHSIRSAVVCIGSAPIHRWQEHEIHTILIEFVDRRLPVIPLFLPNAPESQMVPVFLRTMTWVDFRKADPPPLQRLIWGITGQRPIA